MSNCLEATAKQNWRQLPAMHAHRRVGVAFSAATSCIFRAKFGSTVFTAIKSATKIKNRSNGLPILSFLTHFAMASGQAVSVQWLKRCHTHASKCICSEGSEETGKKGEQALKICHSKTRNLWQKVVFRRLQAPTMASLPRF